MPLQLPYFWCTKTLAFSQACNISPGRVLADTSCSKGYQCCDAVCAASIGNSGLQVITLRFIVHMQVIYSRPHRQHCAAFEQAKACSNQYSGCTLQHTLTTRPENDALLTAFCRYAHVHACVPSSAIHVQAYCVPSCAENKIGLIFYRYILTNIATLNGVDILMTLLYRLLGMAVPYDPASVRRLMPKAV